ncbi:DUF3606 domain-containing protein [Bradyrhizobium sp. CCBAU 051011]|uniref:DUF3606 domain-containing protein n=1 Tax=Bradyrhizobium sp. CCBAU 051011 TaxID=858422 RepID=UPI001379B178
MEKGILKALNVSGQQLAGALRALGSSVAKVRKYLSDKYKATGSPLSFFRVFGIYPFRAINGPARLCDGATRVQLPSRVPPHSKAL